MEKEILVDSTIPLWAVLSTLGSCILFAIWNMVKLYFSDKQRITELVAISTKINLVEIELDKHKVDSDKKIDEVKASINSMRDNLIEVKTLVKLLVGDRIKRPDEK
jgi:hypothetical protein